MSSIYDTHAHLDFPDYAGDLSEVLARAAAAGVTRIVTIGTDLASSRRAIELAAAHEEVYAVVGWHPCHVSGAPADVRPVLRELAAHPKVVGLGETGLDYHHLPAAEEGGGEAAREALKVKQAEIFRQHLEVAGELGLNCVVHQRDSMADTLALVETAGRGVRCVFHCFTGTVGDLERILATGSLVSYTGIATFKSAHAVREAVAATPLDQLMLETDCPYLAPVPYRGKRCEPSYVVETAQVVAGVKGCSMEWLSEATCGTAEAFFRGLLGGRVG